MDVATYRRAHRSVRDFPESAIDLLSGNSFAEFEEQEVRLIGERLAAECLASLSAGERMLLDGTATATPDTGELFRDDVARNYSTPHEHLAAFIVFCRRCKGFRVE